MAPKLKILNPFLTHFNREDLCLRFHVFIHNESVISKSYATISWASICLRINPASDWSFVWQIMVPHKHNELCLCFPLETSVWLGEVSPYDIEKNMMSTYASEHSQQLSIQDTEPTEYTFAWGVGGEVDLRLSLPSSLYVGPDAISLNNSHSQMLVCQGGQVGMNSSRSGSLITIRKRIIRNRWKPMKWKPTSSPFAILMPFNSGIRKDCLMSRRIAFHPYFDIIFLS